MPWVSQVGWEASRLKLSFAASTEAQEASIESALQAEAEVAEVAEARRKRRKRRSEGDPGFADRVFISPSWVNPLTQTRRSMGLP